MKRANQHRKAHSSLLIFLGALTVFVTFVLKEGIAERFKDSVVTLEQAQDIFGLRQEIAHLRLAIFSAAGTSPTDQAALVQQVRFANIGHDFVEEGMETISQVLVRVEAGNDLWRRFDTLKQELLQEKREYRELQDGLFGRNGKQAKSLDEIRVKLEALRPTGDRMREEDQTLQRDIINTAKEKRDRDERYYKISKWAGYVLYTIGWSLGLVGKLNEVRVEATD
jgi:hypothetical protein